MYCIFFSFWTFGYILDTLCILGLKERSLWRDVKNVKWKRQQQIWTILDRKWGKCHLLQLPKNQLANSLTTALKITKRGPNMGKHIFSWNLYIWYCHRKTIWKYNARQCCLIFHYTATINHYTTHFCITITFQAY